LRRELDPSGLRRVFVADAWWGGAAGLWIGTGIWRLLGGLEKSTSYYLQNQVFLTKMGLLLLILLVEVRPMLALMRWRAAAAGRAVDTSAAGTLATISYVQVALVVLMVFAATAMARGIGAPQP
jgi:putative membrane protein